MWFSKESKIMKTNGSFTLSLFTVTTGNRQRRGQCCQFLNSQGTNTNFSEKNFTGVLYFAPVTCSVRCIGRTISLWYSGGVNSTGEFYSNIRFMFSKCHMKHKQNHSAGKPQM